MQTLLASALNGDRSSLARLLSHIERDPSAETEIRAGLASTETESVVIGVTGPPGAGKGTQATAVAAHVSVPHVSTGDIFRRHLKQGTELAQ